MLTNEDLEKIQQEAKAIQHDPNASLDETKAALTMDIGASGIIIARMKQDLIKDGFGEDVARIEAKARGFSL